MNELELLARSLRSEKDVRVHDRMLAVHAVRVNGSSRMNAAETLCRCEGWVTKWPERFDRGGVDALRDLPRGGAARKVPLKTIKREAEKLEDVL